MQRNFKQMSTSDLKKYILAHRNEIEPLHELYERRSPDDQATWFAPPETKQEEAAELEQLKRMIAERTDNQEQQDEEQ